MKKPTRRLTAALLSLLLLLPAGCGGGKADTPAMGRYVESEVQWPAAPALCTALRQTADGVLRMLAYPEPGEGSNLIYLHSYQSADGGVTWTEDTPAWLDFFNGEGSEYGAIAAAWGTDGVLWLLAQGYGNDDSIRMARVEGETLELCDWAVPNASDGSGPRGLQIAGNGDIVLDAGSEFLQIDPESGSVEHVYTAAVGNGGYWNDGWAVSGNTLVLSEFDRLVWYDLSTGKESRSLACKTIERDTYGSGIYRVMAFQPDGTLVFADTQGIYHVADGSDTLERLADGSLTSLSVPSIAWQSMVALENRYLVLGWSNDRTYHLYSYVYDPDTPTLPGQELAVWSLNDDPLVRQAVAAIQKGDPGIHVTYQVAISGEDAVTVDDALRALATQITAGKCPDVMVLDGINIDSYIEKGVLSDLSDRLKPLTDSGAVLSNISSTYRQEDGKVYAVPAQFRVPLLHSSDEAMNSISSLPTMVDWLEENSGSFRFPSSLYTTAANLSFFYPAIAYSMTGPDGGMDEAALRDFLVQMKRILDLRAPGEDWESYNSSTDFNFGALSWMAGAAGLDVGNLCMFEELYAAWTASQTMGGSIDTLFGGSTFLPVTVLGISAQSKQQDAAWSFIEAVLSDEVQGKAVGLGLPASTAALDASAELDTKKGGDPGSYYATSYTDAEGADVPVELELEYPPEAWRRDMLDRLKSLDTPLFFDATVLQLIQENAAGYFAGKTDLDAAVTAMMQKLKLYEAE